MKPRAWRSILFYVCFLSLLLTYDLLLRLRMIAGRQHSLAWAKRMAPQMSRTVFAVTRVYMDHTIEVSGTIRRSELPDRFLLVSNHQSIVDIPVLASVFPHHSLRFTAKHSLFRHVPLISPMLRLQGHAAVYRGTSRRKTFRELERLGRLCRREGCPVVFPEGTRSRNGELGRFHAGATSYLTETCRLPVVCVTMDGGFRVADASSLGTNLQGCRYRVYLEGVFPCPIDREETEHLLGKLREVMSYRLKEWRNREET